MRTNCQELLNIETISSAFKNNSPDLSEQIISCLYANYQSLFLKWAAIAYQQYAADVIEFAANNSFTDGVLKFKEAASRGELYRGNATVKTILFHYCRNMLLGYLTTERRLSEKNKKLEPFFSNEVEYNVLEKESEAKEMRHENIMLALASMTVEDRQIIQWRHIEEKSNDEIAELLAIKVTSATNRIYRCMQRLRELVEGME